MTIFQFGLCTDLYAFYAFVRGACFFEVILLPCVKGKVIIAGFISVKNTTRHFGQPR